VRKIESRLVWGPATNEQKELVRLFSQESSILSGDFSVRLERATKPLLVLRDTGGVEATRVAISEALHQSVLGKLRVLLGEVLTSRRRVAVLVDNLDKPWTK
jgi:hypothetical protein